MPGLLRDLLTGRPPHLPSCGPETTTSISSLPSAQGFLLTPRQERWDSLRLEQRVSTFLVLHPFNTVPRVVVTHNHTILSVVALGLLSCYCYVS